MKEIIIGLILGFGKIVPGMSGSVLAISLNVYEKAINSFSNISNYKNLIFLMKLAVGIIVSIALFSKAVLYLLTSFKTEVMLLFIGLILGSKEEVEKNIKAKYLYLTFISFFVIILFNFYKGNNSIFMNSYPISYFTSGIIESISSIVPGVSGTAVLMLLGTYDEVIYIFSNIFNINYILENVKVLIPFISGIIIGFILSIKMINYLLSNYFYQTYNIILGFLYGSVFVMLLSIKYTFFNTFIGLLLFLLSYFMIKKVNHLF